MQPATREEPCEQRTKLPVWANTHRSVILTFCCVVCNANLFFTFNKTFITLKKVLPQESEKTPGPSVEEEFYVKAISWGNLKK